MVIMAGIIGGINDSGNIGNNSVLYHTTFNNGSYNKGNDYAILGAIPANFW